MNLKGYTAQETSHSKTTFKISPSMLEVTQVKRGEEEGEVKAVTGRERKDDRDRECRV